MPALKAPWLAIVGSIMLAIGLYLSFTGQTGLYPGPMLLAGSACWGLFFLLNDPWWNGPVLGPDPDEPPPPPADPTPYPPKPES